MTQRHKVDGCWKDGIDTSTTWTDRGHDAKGNQSDEDNYLRTPLACEI